MRRIEPYSIWVGHAGDGRAFGALFDHEIRAVVQLAMEEPPIAPPRSVIVLRFPLVDGGGNEDWLLRLAVNSVSHLLTADIPTLVCCGAGMSRAPAIVAAAISTTKQLSRAACLEAVTSGAAADVSPVLWQDICRVMEPNS